MPLEEKKESSYSPYAEAPSAAEPGAPAPKKGVLADGPLIPIQRAPRPPEPEPLLANRKVQIIGGAVGAVLLIIILYFIFHTTNKVTGRTKSDAPYQINNNQTVVQNFQVVGKATYTLEVISPDGDLQIGVAKRNPKDSSNLTALKKLSYKIAGKGQTTEESGIADTGDWSWFVFNESKKLVKVKIKFLAEPQK